MLVTVSTALWVIGLLFMLYLSRTINNQRAYTTLRRKKGCSEIKKYPHREPFLGLDMFLEFAKSMQSRKVMSTIEGYFLKYGKTFQSNSWGTKVINTMDPRIIQTVLALEFDKFGVEPTRKKALNPIMQDGIFVSDGSKWVHSRASVKQIFSGVRNSSVVTMERHVERLLSWIPRDGSTVDLQPLLKRLFLDKTTEFLFGVSQDSLLAKEPSGSLERFDAAVDRARIGVHTRYFLGWFKILRGRDTQLKKDVAQIHEFVDKYVNLALQRKEEYSQATADSSKYIFLDELVKISKDRSDLRNQVLNVFLPSRDSASSAIGFVFFHLARNRRVWEKLRREVLDFGPTPLTFESLKSLKYLRFVINESLRLISPGGMTIRTCLEDCVIPCGGGISEQEPILVQKGTEVRIIFHALHKDPDIWGEDALEFRPERWETMRTTWEYVPFLGGGRTCPAQQMALTDCSYILVRFLQEFREIENRDEQVEFVESIKLSLESGNGVKVGFITN